MIQTLSIMVTNRCPLQCDHCGPRSGPWENGSIDSGTLRDILDDARSLGCRAINYTGGEPFILGKRLIEIVSLAVERDFLARITTGAYWSSSTEAASRKLAPLAEAGLSQLFISVSDSHRKFVPLDNVINAVRAAREIDIQVCLAVGVTRTSETQAGSIHKAFEEAGVETPWMIASPLIPFGRAEETLSDDELLLQPVARIDGPCPSLTINPSVRADGRVVGCSVVFGDYCPPLSYGNVTQNTLAESVSRMRSDPLAAWIHKVGVVELKKIIERNTTLRFADDYVNICHLCGDIMSNPDALAFLQAIRLLDSEKAHIEQ